MHLQAVARLGEVVALSKDRDLLVRDTRIVLPLREMTQKVIDLQARLVV